MTIQLRYLVFVLLFVSTAWLGHRLYRFFFDTTQPFIIITGIDNDKCYMGDIACKISSDKSGQLAVWLDEKPLIGNFKLHAGQDSYPFVIPTKTIANGKHNIKIDLVDSTFNKNRSAIERSFYVDNIPLQAAFIKQELQYKVLQGRTLHVQFQVNKQIEKAHAQALAHTYTCTCESALSSIYECFIPITCEEIPNEYLLSVTIVDKVGNKVNLDTKFQVIPFPFKTQNLHVDAKQAAAEKEVGMDQALLEEFLAHAYTESPQAKLWKGAFCTPLEIKKVTCEFGTVRTTQEKGRYAHKALDVIDMPKSVVWATQDGIVIAKDRYAMSGNTVVIDHGLGLLSLFYHLEDFANITIGQKICKGNPLGRMGKTGYAQGYHLHWEMRLNNIPIDPMQWTKINF